MKYSKVFNVLSNGREEKESLDMVYDNKHKRAEQEGIYKAYKEGSPYYFNPENFLVCLLAPYGRGYHCYVVFFCNPSVNLKKHLFGASIIRVKIRVQYAYFHLIPTIFGSETVSYQYLYTVSE